MKISYKIILFASFAVLVGMSPMFFSTDGMSQDSASALIKVDCSGLNGNEQQFALGLTLEHKALFCQKFTPVQRAAAMQMTSQPDPIGMLISPDQAVQKVADANQLTPQTQPQCSKNG